MRFKLSDIDRLKEIVKEKSLRVAPEGEFFELASGAKSKYFLDAKITLLDPEGAKLTGKLLLEKIPDDIDAVGGLELGACPAVSNMCVIAGQQDRENLRFFYVRKQKKGRGTNQLIEGSKIQKGDKIAIIEDVTTSGGSALKAVEIVESLGAKVVKILSVVDREEGAEQNLSDKKIDLDCIFKKSDLF
jgi:orotate phosphoribosyltransferase